MACESQTGVNTGKVTGSVRYRQRIALPSDARLVVKLEYVVRAQIFYGDKLRWTSTRAYPVITQGNPLEVTIAISNPHSFLKICF